MARLLLVDDDVSVLRFVQAATKDIADLRVARSGQDALRLLRTDRPDLLLLDLQLGDANGLELLMKMRTDSALANIPVIFLSGEAGADPRVQALDLDALDWLPKPLDERRLRARIQAALDRIAKSPQPVPPNHDEPLDGACVLIVDDDPIMLDALEHALAPQNFRLVRATDSREALKLASEQAPEVVLLDIGLPGLNGFELAYRLMAMPKLADCPLLFVTQYGELETELQALQMGAFDFVSKPFVPAVLRARVSNALRLRRRSTRALEHAEAHWRRIGGTQLASIVADAHDPIVVLDADDRVVLANQAAHALFGDAAPPGIGSSLPTWLSTPLPATLINGEQHSARSVVMQPPGELAKVYDLSSSLLAAGDARLVALTFHDQTLLMKAQEEGRARLRLESESRARRLMMSYLAHEIGNPLNGIIGFTSLLLNPGAEPLTEEQRRKLSLVGDCAENLRRLMSDALDMARGESGHFSVETARHCLRSPVEAAVAAHQLAAERTGAEMHAPTGDLDVFVRADVGRLRQCLDNLLSNACKYGRPRGRIQVDISAGPVDVEISVSDDGLGMSAAQIERLFQPFERLGRQGPPGHGLGLAVTRMLAHAMGGRLEVASEEGVGTRFTLVLPRDDTLEGA
ncbi:MAG: response regulator [Burkholderiales bacterium]|nr:response regulator [Burkholderiales bacterium]